MGVQTTRHITRAEAMERWVNKQIVPYRKEMVKRAHILDNDDLEDAIEEQFYNYIVHDDDEVPV